MTRSLLCVCWDKKGLSIDFFDFHEHPEKKIQIKIKINYCLVGMRLKFMQFIKASFSFCRGEKNSIDSKAHSLFSLPLLCLTNSRAMLFGLQGNFLNGVQIVTDLGPVLGTMASRH